MRLGEKIRAARLELGLSQRQLCGERITRNMLSQIENGSAHPSMDTLRYLAQRLGRGVSYFLEEADAVSPNAVCIRDARESWKAGNFRQALEQLSSFREPDELLRHERDLLLLLSLLSEAEAALDAGHIPYAENLLQQAQNTPCLYAGQPLRRQLDVLLARAGDAQALSRLSDDETLLLRSCAAQPRRALELLAACEADSPRRALLEGRAHMALQEYTAAAQAFRRAESNYPEEVWASLEQCFRELGDYKSAYEYAIKQRR